MKVKLTDEQVLQLAANAVNAAIPVGMGILQFEEEIYMPDDMKGNLRNGYLSIDYFNGRMTKLTINKEGDEWTFPDSIPRYDYQSWAVIYPTYQALINSVLGE